MRTPEKFRTKTAAADHYADALRRLAEMTDENGKLRAELAELKEPCGEPEGCPHCMRGAK